MERESDVEHYFVEQCKKMGYLTYKFVSPGQAGVPDRIAIDPQEHLYFIEFKKSTSDYPRTLQFAQMQKLAEAGQYTLVLRSKTEVEWFFTGNGNIPTNWQDLKEQVQHENV